MMTRLLNLTRTQKRAMLFAIDICLVPVALLTAIFLQFGQVQVLEWFVNEWAFCITLMMIAAGASTALGIFRIRLKSFDRSAVGKIMVFSALMGLASLTLASLAGIWMPMRFHLTFAMAFFMLCAGSRFVMLEILLAAYRKNGHVSSVLIYGAGKTGMQLASALKSHPDIIPIGFVDDNAALKDQIIAGLPVYHGGQLDEAIAETRPDRVVIAMPSAPRQSVAKIERRLEQTNTNVHVLPSFAQLVGQEQIKDPLDVAHGVFLGREDLRSNIDIGCDEYANRVVMVSGAGGSIGSELSRQIIRCAPSKIVLFEQSELALYDIELELAESATRNGITLVPVLGSVVEPELVRGVLTEHKVDVILHAAAYKHVPLVEKNPIAGLSNNVLGTQNLAVQAREAGVGRFVLVSTDKAVRPANIMGASKRFAEMLIQDQASRATQTVFSIVRFGNVLGSSGSVVPLFQDQVARGGPVTLTHDSVTRYFMTVQEAAQLVLTAGSLAEGGEVFVLDMGKPVPVRKLAEQVIEASGYTVRNHQNPEGDIEIVITGLRAGEKMHEELTISAGRTTTKHEKIFSAREDCLSEIELASALRAMRDAIAANDVEAAEETVHRWIDGYKPRIKNVQ
ncbi:nucleoside-diphosphate sugar epimerase/dehydratase [uncultured Litoreibacter sp.]|uniref:polysaccharide biosynthesis protein n=1 Tax=uncultured Litoreibacter sp. TaxID=1392394 RepID=UPI00261C8932|nr:nucleoside-diphosphate sugar epimerase/dehydratase [uncultured Litoreibacter sp.]